MNISRIRKMAATGDMSIDALRYLIDCHGECEHLDYKEDLSLEEDYDCAKFAKDVLAVKNVGGGFLVIGVKDKTWEPVGLTSRLMLDTKLLSLNFAPYKPNREPSRHATAGSNASDRNARRQTAPT